MRGTAAFVCGVGIIAVTGGGVNSSARTVDRIRRVEAGLLSAVVLKDHAAPMTLADRMAYYDVPGVSVAVIDGGRIEWAKGYGVLEAGRAAPVEADSRFQAASISKPLTAMAALALVEQGKLRLDDDVNLTLTSWQVPGNEFTRTAKVTVRRLLNHSAGATGADVGSYLPGQPADSRSGARRARARQDAADPHRLRSRQPVAVLGRWLPRRAAAGDAGGREAVSSAAAGAGSETDRHEAELI